MSRSYLVVAAVTVLGCSSSNHVVSNASAKKTRDAGHADSGAKSTEPEDASLAHDASSDAGSIRDAGGGVTSIALPNGAPGIGFDDLQWARKIHKVLAPAGRSGTLDLVDPDTLAVEVVEGFSKSDSFSSGSHGAGTTSADEAGSVILALDHESQSLRLVDPTTRSIKQTGPVSASPDYVRFVAQTGEAWVTQPFTGIEVLTVPASGAPEHSATIDISGGPEGLVIDSKRGRAYTNSFTGQTYAVELASRKVVETWPNGCGLSLGLALDVERGFVIVACQAGSVVVLDAANAGAKLGELKQGAGLDVLSYDPGLHHLYVQGSSSGDLGIVGISAKGEPTLLGTLKTTEGSSTSTTDENGRIFVADPAAGALLVVRDGFPKTD
jgi:hypothetical protein